MNSLTRVLVIIAKIMVWSTQGSTSSSISGINSLELGNATSYLSFSDVLDLILNTTEDFKLDLNGLTDELNVNLTSILSSLNTVSDDGLLDLKSFITNLNITNQVNMTEVFSLLNVKLDDLLDLESLIQQFKDVDLTEIVNSLSVNTSEDESLDFVGLAQKWNLAVEAYNVTTEDGYILQIFHIPGNGTSVLLNHGLFDTSDGFIIRGETSLAYILAQNGFDVWAMNYRGNRYSRNHKTLDPDTDQIYWEFSMHEKGYYDLPAVIDFVLNKTGQDQLSVIGHSQGTATVFVLTSTKPEYNKKIKLFIALSPVCYLSDGGFAITAAIRLWPILKKLLLATGNREWLGYNSFSRKVIQSICSQGTVGYDLCYRVVLGSVFGYNPSNLEQTFFPTLLDHFPAGASSKDVDHYFSQSNVFGQYDYGSKNIEVYGSETAPIYNLKNVTCNVILVVSKNDKVLGLKAGKRLQGELPNVVDYSVVEDELFTHADFVYGKSANESLYPYIFDKLNSEF